MPSFLKSTSLLHVATALIFAAVTLIVSVMLDNHKHKEVIVLLILGLYLVPAGIIEQLKSTDEQSEA